MKAVNGAIMMHFGDMVLREYIFPEKIWKSSLESTMFMSMFVVTTLLKAAFNAIKTY